MAIHLDKFTVKAQNAIQRAQSLAAERSQQTVEPLHLLAALLEERDGVVRPLLNKHGVNVEQLERIALSELDRLPKVSGVGGGEYLSNELKSVLEAAQK